MGIYLNPPADAFAAILKKNIYVDKSGLISYTNSVLNSSRMLTCFSRPRRFGKSYAAKMLAAYYSKGADSDSLFQNLEISGMDGYKENLNQYDVLFLDVAWFISISSNIQNTISEMQDSIIEELRSAFPNIVSETVHSLPVALLQISAKQGENSLSLLMSGMLCFVKQRVMNLYRDHISSYCELCLKGSRYRNLWLVHI